MSRTISTSYASQVSLTSGDDNPVTITGAGTLSGGLFGASGTAWTVTNYGVINPAAGYGVSLAAGGAVTNTGGTISGAQAAIRIAGASGTVVNSGQISSSGNNGVTLAAGGSVTDLSGGGITGSVMGVAIAGAAGTVTNAGTIAGTGGTAVSLAAGFANRVIVDPGAVFTGKVSGGNTLSAATSSTLELASAASTGTLVSLSTRYINFAQVTVDTGASWSLGGADTLAGKATMVNYGTLNGVLTANAGSVLTNASGATLTSSGYAVLATGGSGTFTMINAGSITAGSSFVSAVKLNLTAHATNESTGTITGTFGIFVGGSATLTNAGQIVASTGTYGRAVDNYGTLINLTGGTISGHYGVEHYGSLTNYGVISGNVDGVFSGTGFTRLVNEAGGTIVVNTGTATIVNAGVITGSSTAVQFGGAVGNRLIIDPGATFVGKVLGNNSSSTMELASGASAGTLNSLGSQFQSFDNVTVDSGAAWTFASTNTVGSGITLTNAGSITGPVSLASGAVLSNAAGGTIKSTAAGAGAVIVQSSGATVTNVGYIRDTGGAAAGVTFSNGGLVTNQSGGTISAYYGVFIANAAGTVVNTGLIQGGLAGGRAVGVWGRSGAATLTNLAGGTIKSVIGVEFGGGTSNTAVNAGLITGSNDGILFAQSGLVTNQSGGTITSGGAGVSISASVSVTNQSGGLIHGSNGIVVAAQQAATVTNAGTITGTTDAVKFGATANSRLIVDPGASFTGTVSGGNTIGATNTSTLELASGASGGTLTGLGSEYILFGSIAVDAGASWLLTSDSIASGYTIADSGTLTNSGTLGSGVTLASGAKLTNASGGLITASGTAVTGPASGAVTVVNAGSISGSSNALLFTAGAADRLIIDPGAAFTGTVDGGNTIGGAFASTLELASAASAATLTSLGSRYTHFANIIVDSGAQWTLASDSIASGYTVTDNGTLTNTGTLGSSVTLTSAAVLTNASGGTIVTSGQTAVSSGGAATVINDGFIGGAGSHGVDFGISLGSGGMVTNQSAGTISGNGGVAVTGTAGSLLNYGTISAVVIGVYLHGGATVTNASSGTISGATDAAVYLESSTLINAGLVESAFYAVNGNTGGPGSQVTNLSGGRLIDDTGGGGGVYLVDGVVSNAGSIGSDLKSGIYLSIGGDVTNLSSGVITGGGGFGVSIALGAGIVVNSGDITGALEGVYLASGGTVSNAGSIVGNNGTAVLFHAGATNRLIVDPGAVFTGTVNGGNTIGATSASTLELASAASAGTLTSLGSKYVHFADITVDAGARWKLTSDTLASGYTITDAGTLTNTGTLSSAVTLGSGAVLTNASGGTITNSGDAVVSSSNATVTNYGVINATTGYGISLETGGSVTNTGGTIGGFQAAIYITGSTGTVVNSGAISGSHTNGVELKDGGSVSNLPTGSIYGLHHGVYAYNGAGTVVNAGTISAPDHGVDLYVGGIVTNLSGGLISGPISVYVDGAATITNGVGPANASGIARVTNANGATIAGSVNVAYGSVVNAGVVTNAGTNSRGVELSGSGSVTNQATGTISSAYGVWALSVASSATVTVVNAGHIAGTTDAVKLTSGNANLVVIDPGASFTGTVDGGNMIGAAHTSTLELASAASAGTLTGLGSQYIHFANIAVDSGAAWTLTSDSIASGYTVTDSGTLTNTGTLGSAVTLGSGAQLTNATGATITSSGTSVVDNAGPGTVSNSGAILSGTGGVYLHHGGGVTNNTGGTIIGGAGLDGNGVYIIGGTGTVANTGSIVGGNDYAQSGVALHTGGSLTNNSGGTIAGYYGFSAYSAAGTVINAGSIGGLSYNQRHQGEGIFLWSGGSVTNQSTGTITGGYYAIKVVQALTSSAAGTVVNAGLIQANPLVGTLGVGGAAIQLNAGGSVTNQSSGTIGGHYGIYTGNGGTVVNQGIIAGAASGTGIGVYLGIATGNYVTNLSTGTITGALGVKAVSATVTNAGSIGGALTTGGVGLIARHVTNQSGGLVTGRVAVSTNNTLTLTNVGSIGGASTSGGIGVSASSSGQVTNQSGGMISGYIGVTLGSSSTLINAGAIAGASTASGLGAQLSAGQLTNQAGGTISGAIGVSVNNIGTVTNAGQITGTTDAVKFSAGSTHRLIVDPGAGFSGTIEGGNTIGATSVSTLELASGATAGTIAGIGSTLIDFAQTTIDANASWTFIGANTLVSGATLTNAGTLTLNAATLNGSGAVVNNGAILLDPSTLSTSALTGTGTVTIGAGGVLVTTGTVASTEIIAFATTTGEIELSVGSGGNFAGQIDGFATGDTLSLTGVTDATHIGVLAGNTLAVTSTSLGVIDLDLNPTQDLSGATFNVVETGGNAIVTADNLPCFVAGTRIGTPSGPVAVEMLRAGDSILTASGSIREVRWIGHRRLDLTRHGDPKKARPIRIRTGALADGVPTRDLLVSPDHAMLLQGLLIPARLLINGASILPEERWTGVTYYHVELDSHDILLAEGAAAESYLDTGNRGTFENAAEPMRLHPDMSTDQGRRQAESCAPFAADAERVRPIWHSLRQRALKLGLRQPEPHATTTDPSLRIEVAGRTFKPVAVTKGRYIFFLPALQGVLRLLSLSAAPSDGQPWMEDQRQLGVMVRRMLLSNATEFQPIPVDHPALGPGWWDTETDTHTMWRWTNGEAEVALHSDTPCRLEVEVGDTMMYVVAEAARIVHPLAVRVA